MLQLRSVLSSKGRLGPVIALSYRCPAIARGHSSLEEQWWSRDLNAQQYKRTHRHAIPTNFKKTRVFSNRGWAGGL